MKIKKLLLAFILVFAFSSRVMAKDAAYVEHVYSYYESFYRIIGAINYYYDSSSSFGNATVDTEQVWRDAINKFGLSSVNTQMENMYKTYSGISGDKWESTFIRDAEEIALILSGKGSTNQNGDVATQLCSGLESNEENHGACIKEYTNYSYQIKYFTSFPSMLKYAKDYLNGLAKDYKTATGSNTYEDKYNGVVDTTKDAYSNICDFLDNSPGTSYYIKTALRLINYAALALAVILGALDFIKAITSNDDAALKKAFQSFMKRLVAVVLIFLTYMIVQMILGLTSSLPGQRASDPVICDILKP